MSLVSTWVEATDGRYYQNPVLEGPGWFICFDDDDPPELVVTKRNLRTFQQILQDAKIPWKSIGLGCGSGTGNLIFNGKFKEAKATFFELAGPIPIPQRFDSVHDNPEGQGCYYRFSKKRHGA